MVFANEPFIVEAYELRIQCDGSARSVDECEKELWISGLDNCQSEVFIFCLPPEGKSLHSHFFFLTLFIVLRQAYSILYIHCMNIISRVLWLTCYSHFCLLYQKDAFTKLNDDGIFLPLHKPEQCLCSWYLKYLQ